jgi:thioredoxin reductase (NADPH)
LRHGGFSSVNRYTLEGTTPFRSGNRRERGMSDALRASDDVVDILILGGGPAGATAALYAARAGRSCRVVDKGVTSGALGMSREIANFPGFADPISGAELVERLRAQAARYGAVFVADRVTATSLEGPVKKAWGTRAEYRGRTMVVATGSMGRAASLPGEERLIGRGVSYCATCDGFFFRDQVVAVVGDTDEAVEEALVLARLARHVHILLPAEVLRGPADTARRLQETPAVEIRRSTRVEEILGRDHVEGLRLKTRGETSTIPVSGVFLYLQGARPIVDFLAGRADVSPDGCLVVDSLLQSSVPGVFAAGDVLCKHLKQAVIAAAEGAAAAVAADRYLSGHAKLRPDWS